METEEAETGADSAAKEKQARAQASIKEREREVQRALATSLRDRDKEREQHKRDEAVQGAAQERRGGTGERREPRQASIEEREREVQRALATSLRDRDKEREQHKRDEAVQERLFTQHTSSLASKRRDKLRALLTELSVSCTSHWKEVKDMLKNEPTAPVYSSSSQRDKQSAAKTQLRQLLLETRSITHKSFAAVKENNAAMGTVHDALKHDARRTTPPWAPCTTPGNPHQPAQELRRREGEQRRHGHRARRAQARRQVTLTSLHKSFAAVKENNAAMGTVHDALKHDAR
ncbi:Transcription elongation regulator 1 [Operophtera brumata]|uniref:Transcription elongation regulator 1 n=1 Tax=Operophtera brumata TaxID=104452 RepID=A0A0L7LT11_OPEBR|nr:Transcription elongation regulator 1 [Operophtera brumata]